MESKYALKIYWLVILLLFVWSSDVCVVNCVTISVGVYQGSGILPFLQQSTLLYSELYPELDVQFALNSTLNSFGIISNFISGQYDFALIAGGKWTPVQISTNPDIISLPLWFSRSIYSRNPKYQPALFDYSCYL